MSTVAARIPTATRKKRLPPGPPGWELYLSLLRAPKSFLYFLDGIRRQYGDICYLRLFGTSMCYVSRPEIIESVLVSGISDFSKSKDYAPLKTLMGTGLVTSEGEFWRRQRKLVQPGFHRERIAAYGETMVEYAEQMAAEWRDGESRDAHQDMMKLTLNIVAKTLFGADVASDGAAVGETLEVAMNRYSKWAWLAVFLPTGFMAPWNRLFRPALERLDSVIYRIIAARRKDGSDPGDLLSLLLRAQAEDGSQMTDKQLRDEVMTLFLAGHETTANALSWTWVLLSQNPEAEERLYAELREVLRGRSPRVEDLPRLRYAQMVVKESLRLLPPVWAIGRRALREVSLGGYHVPAGTNVFMSQWVVHRDPRFFDRPSEFLPERWTEEFEKRLPKFAYFPFGGGPRVCVGASFALMEAALLLATLAQRYRFVLEPAHEVTLLASVTLRPKHGVRVRPQKRVGGKGEPARS